MKIDHIGLYVKDLEGAREFFETWFAGRANKKYHNPKTGFSSYFIAFDDGSRLELMNKAGLSEIPEEAYGLVHLSFALGSKEAVDSLSTKLDESGFPILNGPRTTGDGYYECVVSGFEGNRLELTV